MVEQRHRRAFGRTKKMTVSFVAALLAVMLLVVLEAEATFQCFGRPSIMSQSPCNPFSMAALPATSTDHHHLHHRRLWQLQGKKDKAVEEQVNFAELSLSEKIETAASFLALQLTMSLTARVMQAEQAGKSGDPKNEQILMQLSNMMQQVEQLHALKPDPSVENVPVSIRTASAEEVDDSGKIPSLDELMTTISEEKEQPAPVEDKPALGLKKSCKPTTTATTKPDPVPTEPVVRIETPSKQAKETPKISEIMTKSKPVVSTASQPTKTSSVVATEKEAPSSRSAAATATIPPCISTEFGQALPVTAEDLPPLREPIIVPSKKTDPVAPSATAKAVTEKTKTTPNDVKSTTETTPSASSAVLVTPPPANTAEAVPQKTKAKEKKSDPVVDTKSEKKQETKTTASASPAVLVTPPPSKPEQPEEAKAVIEKKDAVVDKKMESEKKQETMTTSSASPALLVTPPPSEPSEPMKAKAKEEVEGKTTKENTKAGAEKDTSARVLVPPPPPVESKENVKEPTKTENQDNKENDDASTTLDKKKVEEKEPVLAEKKQEKDTTSTKSLDLSAGAKAKEETEKREKAAETKGVVMTPAKQSSKSIVEEDTSARILLPKPPKDVNSKNESDGRVSALSSAAREPKGSPKFSSLGDQAAAVLKDLGMMEDHPDPDDPDYDHSKDDEIADSDNYIRKR